MLSFRKSIYSGAESNMYKYLPWAILVGEGIVLQKDGILQKTIAFRGPDLDAASSETVAALSYQVNDAIKRMGSGWAVFFESQRYTTTEYLGSKHYNKAAFVIDEERRLAFKEYGRHYDSCYYITITYKLPREATKKAANIFVKSDNESDIAKEEIENFDAAVKDFAGIIASRVRVEMLDDTKTLSYIHSSLSFNWHVVNAPEFPMFLDRILPDEDIELGLNIKIGDMFAVIVSINDFPTKTYPGILDALNRAEIEYRWVTRYICLDKEEGLKEIERYQKKYYGGRKSFKQLLSEAATKEDDGRVNQGAISLEADAIEAQVETTRDEIGYGYFTSTIMVWDREEKVAEKKAAFIKQVVQQNGFVCRTETFNAAEAFFGMMPGNIYANIRRPLLSTLNTAHIVPLTAVWSGDPFNHYFNEILNDGTPHITCSTKFGTTFYLSLNIGDVMHTFIAGPSGAGKSVLLGTLAIQFLRYDNARIIIFDKDRSAKQLTYAVGGQYYEPGTGEVTFQPLEHIDNEEEIIWAIEFIELLLDLQSISVDAGTRKSILDAIKTMQGIPKKNRTLTTFHQYVQDTVVKQGVLQYTLEGPYGAIFDSDSGSITESSWLMIEMDPLMQLGKAAVMPALMYLFKQVDLMFDGRPTLLILDEAWLFLQHPIFQRQMQNWLKTLRKKRVGVIFATQEIADAAKSEIMATILQQCHTKIYLPDEEATSPAMKVLYKDFGLTEGEINVIARGKKKADYFYKSQKGVRLFRLDLGTLALALITNPNHELLNKLTPGDNALTAILEDKLVIDIAQRYLVDNPEMDTRG